jgi:hypothetical protein
MKENSFAFKRNPSSVHTRGRKRTQRTGGLTSRVSLIEYSSALIYVQKHVEIPSHVPKIKKVPKYCIIVLQKSTAHMY